MLQVIYNLILQMWIHYAVVNSNQRFLSVYFLSLYNASVATEGFVAAASSCLNQFNLLSINTPKYRTN